VATEQGGFAARRQYPEPVGRSCDPDWSFALVLLAVVWFAAVGVGAYFFWTAVAT
jgi:hypothetical protein